MNTYVIPDGYDRHKHPVHIRVRPMTRSEVLSLTSGKTAEIEAADGKLRRVKINGKVRTWKRSPHRIEVPIKYGMYEYATLTYDPTTGHTGNGVCLLVVRVE